MKREVCLLLSLAVLSLLSSCGDEQPQPQTIEREATTAVLLEDAVLSWCYTQLMDDSGQMFWVTVPEDQDLHQGDLVLLVEETEDTAWVLVPPGDTPPGIYGTLPAAVLSQEEADLCQANLADARGVMAYESVDGPEAEELLGLVHVLDRQDGWCQVQTLAGGDIRTFWVLEDTLSYDLDRTVSDWKNRP